MTPIHIQDATQALGSVLGQQQFFNQSFDIGGASTHSYYEMLQILTRKLGLKRVFIQLPFNFILMSRFWVRLFSGASKELVYPLLDSLKYSMVAQPQRKYPMLTTAKSYEEALDEILSHPVKVKFAPGYYKRKYVRSVQRVPLPLNKDATWAAKEYMRWLPKFMFPFILVSVDGDMVNFSLIFPGWVLLRLRFAPERSTADRSLFYIVGGLLAIVTKGSRLEFRETLDQKYILTAIHDFIPSLPWWIYIYTQAIIHLFVMNNFGKHLKRLAKGDKK